MGDVINENTVSKFLDDLPLEILEAYEVIEKLLSPRERVTENDTTAYCLLLILKKLYDHRE